MQALATPSSAVHNTKYLDTYHEAYQFWLLVLNQDFPGGGYFFLDTVVWAWHLVRSQYN